ncbi:MAG: 2-carboxy-1,4-naphthoquinone phytyltransferase [Cyanobacteria bacterium P01_F01_bin.153]
MPITSDSNIESPTSASALPEVSPSSPPVEPSRQQLWKAAIKLPMYTVAVIPIFVGSAVAAYDTGQINGLNFGLFLVGAIAIIAWLNLTNDVFDADTGIDVHKAHSVVNLTGSKSKVFLVSNLFLLLGIGLISTISLLQKDATVLGIMLVACFLGYTYQGPPFRLGYLGLGEPICFLTFGPLALSAAYYSQSPTFKTFRFDNPNWLAAVFIGITTSLILLCSHFHQVKDDLAAGKNSPVARLGTQSSAYVVTTGCVLAFGVIIGGAISGILPITALLCLISVPSAIKLCGHVLAHHDQPELIKTSKFIAVNWHFWSGLFLGLGILIGKMP